MLEDPREGDLRPVSLRKTVTRLRRPPKPPHFLLESEPPRAGRPLPSPLALTLYAYIKEKGGRGGQAEFPGSRRGWAAPQGSRRGRPYPRRRVGSGW
jgi:hypothetical protein